MNWLMDQIIRGNFRPRVDCYLSAENGGWTPESLRAFIRQYSYHALAVDIQDVLEWCAEELRTHKVYPNEGLLPKVPNRLPYPVLWLEGSLREDISERIAQLGMLLFEIENPQMPAGHGIGVFHFVRMETETPLLMGGFGLRAAPIGEMVDDLYAFAINNDPEDDRYHMLMSNACYFTLNTLIFFSCKNVPVRLSESRAKQNKKSLQRSGIPVPDFYVIDIHHSGRDAGQPSHQSEHHLSMHAHVVRGHFKHYSKDAPLMGKHVGAWFWSPQVQGQGKLKLPEYRVWSPSEEHLPHCKVKVP